MVINPGIVMEKKVFRVTARERHFFVELFSWKTSYLSNLPDWERCAMSN